LRFESFEAKASPSFSQRDLLLTNIPDIHIVATLSNKAIIKQKQSKPSENTALSTER